MYGKRVEELFLEKKSSLDTFRGHRWSLMMTPFAPPKPSND